jgi:hypothetical protein
MWIGSAMIVLLILVAMGINMFITNSSGGGPTVTGSAPDSVSRK